MTGDPLEEDITEALVADATADLPTADAGDELVDALAADPDDAALTADDIAALIAAEEAFDPPSAGVELAPRVEDVQLPELPRVLAPITDVGGIDLLMDVPLQITVELGQATRTIRELLEIGQGSLLHLSRHAGEPVDVLVNGQAIAKGEVVVIDENFGIRVTEVVSPADRLRTMAA